MAPSDTDVLAHLTRHTTRLEATADALEDAAAPSLCSGWSRGHVLTHLARNADAIAAMCRAAVDDTGETMYLSTEARDADIEAGAGRDAEAQATDLRETDRLVAAQLARLGPEHDERLVERVPGGPRVPAGRLAFMRLREVVYHHADLDAGFGFADVEPDLAVDLVEEEVRRLRALEPVPDLTLRTSEGEEWSVGVGTAEVSGDRSALLAWLARGLTDGVAGDPLPQLPEGR